MIKHYLKSTLRSLRKNFLFAFINIIGLTLGFISILFVFAWVFDETSYDNFHPNVQNMFHVEALMDFESPTLWAQTPAPLPEALKRDFNDVIYSTKIKQFYKPVVKLKDQPVSETGFYFVTPEFFKIFGVHVLSSNPEELISEPNTILISESTAKKYFGHADPIGKNLEVNEKFNYTVKGIFKDYPKNSHLEFNFITSFDNLNLSDRQKTSWGTFNYTTYIALDPNADVELIKENLKTYQKKYKEDGSAEFQLQKVKDIHLYSETGTGNIIYIYVFSVIGILILIIAFINFINISTAKALERTKEIAVRKTFGATRKLLKQQIYTELVLLVVISLVIAIIVSVNLVPVVNNIANKTFTIGNLFNLKLTLTLLILIIVTIFVSGFYPAVYLSSFDPGVIISKKNNQKKGGLLRKILVTLQLTISVAMLLGIIGIQKQLHYIQNKDLGFDKENLMYVNLSYKAEEKFQIVGESILQIPGINNITYSHNLPVNMGQFRHISRWDGHSNDDDAIMVNDFFIDHNFLPTYGVKIKSGRNFRMDDNSSKIIINQRAADKMGLENPVGKRIYMGKESIYEIVGVVENFHYRPLSNEIAPVIMYYEPFNHCITFKLQTKDIEKSIHKIEKVVTEILPEYPFNYGFVDQEIEHLYRSEMRISKLVTIFTIIAIITSCLGIFGLSAFIAQSRTKEIGIRKTLGSSTFKITILMTQEIFFITLIANFLGILLGLRFINNWLNNFKYHIDISFDTFVLVFALSVLIALLTNGFHAIKSSNVNPATVLRYE